MEQKKDGTNTPVKSRTLSSANGRRFEIHGTSPFVEQEQQKIGFRVKSENGTSKPSRTWNFNRALLKSEHKISRLSRKKSRNSEKPLSERAWGPCHTLQPTSIFHGERRNLVPIASRLLHLKITDYNGFEGGAGVGWVERAFMLGFACRLLAPGTLQLSLKENISETQQLTTLNPTYVSASPPQSVINRKTKKVAYNTTAQF